MRTRSQSKMQRLEYEVNIDFDEANAAWNANKKKLPNGCYQYVCGEISIMGKKCMQKVCEKGGFEKCSRHCKRK